MVAYATYLVATAVIDIPNDNNSSCSARHDRTSKSTQEGIYAVGVVFTIFTVGYATIRRASTGQTLSVSFLSPFKEVEEEKKFQPHL
jgi:hypothetical protein